MMQPVTKTNRYVKADGDKGWKVKKPEPILVCECGNKYIKTRRAQQKCINCLMGEKIYGSTH